MLLTFPCCRLDPMTEPAVSTSAAASDPTPGRSFGLIIIGDEILSGKRADKHLSQVISLLAERGLNLSWAQYVGDEPARITAVLRQAFDSGDVVFSTGGIGATPDDHTRACAAAALGVELALHPQAQACIEARMRHLAEQAGQTYDVRSADNQQRLQMGFFPVGADIIPNPYNNIPGFRVGDVHFVPGFPVMAWPMIAWTLDTQYALHFRRGAWREQSIILSGAMEATLTPLMEQIEREHPRVKVFSLPSVDHPTYGRHIELGVKGHPDDVAPAYLALRTGLAPFALKTGPELVR